MLTADSATFDSKPFPSDWDLPADLTGRILAGGLDGSNHETYYLLDFDSRRTLNCTIDVTGYARALSGHLRKHLDAEHLPYGGRSHDAAVFNFVQPHEGLELRDGRVMVGMHNASYVREIHFAQEHVGQFPHEDTFVPRMLSAQNSLSGAGDEYIFASTDMDQRLRAYRDGPAPLDTEVFSVDMRFSSPRKLSTLQTNEVIHEAKVCPDERFIALTEFFLATPGKVPAGRDDIFTDYPAWEDYARHGLYQSSLYLIDRKLGSHVSVPVNRETPGHIEFGRERPERFYLSCHHLSKAHGKLILHGGGSLVTGTLGADGITLTDVFRGPQVYRVTSHKVFAYEGRNYCVLTVFPNRFYVLSEPDLAILEDVQLYEHAPIEEGRLHFCTLLPHMPIWIETSDDGRYVILVANEFFYVFDLKTSTLRSYRGFNFCGKFIGTAHTTNLNDFARAHPAASHA